MNKVMTLAVVLGTLSTPVLADVTRFTGPNGESCTRTTDENDNVSTMCGSSRQRQSRPSMQGDSELAPRRLARLSSIIVGKWQYTVFIKGNPIEATAAFEPDHTYVLALRFPNNPRMGQQVAVESGDYEVRGDVLTTNPSEIKILRGPRPDQLCDLQARRCQTMPLSPSQVELQAINVNTLQGNIEGSDFTAMRLRDQEQENPRPRAQPNWQHDDDDDEGR